MFRYVIEFRKVKKNVEFFGLKEWYEAIVLWCSFDEQNIQNPENYKVLLNLGKVQSKSNMIQVEKKKGIYQTRPSNMFENLENLIDCSLKSVKHHYYANKNSIGNVIPEICVFNKNFGIKQIIDINEHEK